MSKQVSGEVIDIENLSPELAPILAYWQELVPDGAIVPSWSQFDLMKIPLPYLPYCAVADYDAEATTFSYRFWGTQLTETFGHDFTGKSFTSLPVRFRTVSIRTYSAVVARKKPVLVNFAIGESTVPLQFSQALRLPLSNDGTNVSNILTVLIDPRRPDDALQKLKAS